jgi:hypothetical protein
VLVTTVIIYLAGHLIAIWQHDPLNATTWYSILSSNAR